ncbi:PREDICTED: thaumatin-like protein, partial [Rhagoletis zephyria]|uniref:thaumatin-like protein n=1 Tax=Rhagoletis zephyria TaxID=28612 RepID=UPI0008112927
MKFFSCLALLATVATLASANHEIRIHNNCKHRIWPGLLNNPGKALPDAGGFPLDAGHTHVIHVSDGWAGRVWARTGCNGAGHCETGDCGNKIQCHGAGGRPPVSLAEFTFDGHGGMDYYDVSLVDGYNLPIQITPIAGTFRKVGNSHYDCNAAGCHGDLNGHCPHEL